MSSIRSATQAHWENRARRLPQRDRSPAPSGTRSHSYALRYVDERLAVLDGDIDKIVRLLGAESDVAYQFIQVTEAMVELGRDDDALAWAKRGIAETDGWQVAQLYDLAAGCTSAERAGRSRRTSVGAAPAHDLVHHLRPVACKPPKRPASGIQSAPRPGLCWRLRSWVVSWTRSSPTASLKQRGWSLMTIQIGIRAGAGGNVWPRAVTRRIRLMPWRSILDSPISSSRPPADPPTPVRRHCSRKARRAADAAGRRDGVFRTCGGPTSAIP